MKRFFEFVLKPHKQILLVYGLVSFSVLTAYVWATSFAWELISGPIFFSGIALAALFAGFLVAAFLDKKFHWQLKKYFILSARQLVVISVVAFPIRYWQVESSLTKGQEIISTLENYKTQFGGYPDSIEQLNKQLGSSLSERTNIGTRYKYKSESADDYRLNFLSYYGYTAYYSREKKMWTFTD